VKFRINFLKIIIFQAKSEILEFAKGWINRNKLLLKNTIKSPGIDCLDFKHQRQRPFLAFNHHLNLEGPYIRRTIRQLFFPPPNKQLQTGVE